MPIISYTELEDNVDDVSANKFNERFGDIITVLNGNLDAANFKAGGIPVSALSNEIYGKMWPVGSVYMNASDNTNPGTLLGFGTWVAFGSGQVPVGYDAGQTEFNAAQKTGGSKDLQAHSHTGATTVNGDHNHSSANGQNVAIATGSTNKLTLAGSAQQISWGNTTTSTNGNHQHSFTTDNAGAGNSGNLQPYITVYMWLRTS